MKERNRWTRHLLYGLAAAQFPDWFLLVGIEPESVQYIPRASERSGLAEKDQRGRRTARQSRWSLRPSPRSMTGAFNLLKIQSSFAAEFLVQRRFARILE